MRLHHLTVSAFGPFPGTEQVDFDELNDAGLFLLTGPTGGGKSSLLDAVCFALYGTVPGPRGTKTLRSQHASVDARPEVILDFTVRHRRFTVRRSPEWTRPKRRGDGLLTEKSSASILETTDGTEHLLSSRAAEVGLLVTDLMGMSASQFAQVALLPQGQFQTFLQATSQDRHAVLQQLFRTDRFTRIEDWVHDHSRELKDRARSGHEITQRLLDTIADRCGSATPDDLCGDLLPSAAADGRVLGWVDTVMADVRTAAGEATTAHQEACAASDLAVERRQAAERRQQQRVRKVAALQVIQQLEETEDDALRSRRWLDGDDRASRCRPLMALVDQATTAAVDARASCDTALRRLSASSLAARLSGSLSTDVLLALADEMRNETARTQALLPREDAAVDVRRRVADARSQLEEAERRLEQTIERAEVIPAQLVTVAEQLAHATTRSARREALALSLDAARERHLAALALAETRDLVGFLEERHRDARDRAQDARDRVQELLALRLAGMAAELAGALTEGAPCQVCGSTEHPHPAEAKVDAVTDADQAEAERIFAACAEVRDESARRLQEARHRHQGLVDASEGLTLAQCAERVAFLEDELSDARKAMDEQAAFEGQLESMRSEQHDLVRREAEATAQISALRTTVSDLEGTVASIEAEITDAVGDTAVSLRETVAELGRLTELVVQAHRASGLLDLAEDRLAAATDQASETLGAHGFTDPDDVRGALLAEPERERLLCLLHERDRMAHQARAVLDDPDLVNCENDPSDDIAELSALVSLTEATAAATARELHVCEERAAAVTAARERLCAALEEWSPVRDQSLRAESMARLVRGTGHDNHLQMRLSAYVLATRLDSVLAAANERLAQLRDQRYLLQRTARAARKGTQAGLGLEVVDQWTGDVRDPATLSGGETFVVSLSLALGLADVVTHEAGGTEVETLFVDEGFGTLDADTLDDVMDRLDGLRAGGRTVGVVSHVNELRNRIPTQVHVHKGRSGSTVAVRTLVG